MNFVAIKMLTDDRAKYLGMVFHRAIDRVLATLASLGAGALVLIVAGLGVFVAFKLWRRRRFFKELRMARVSAEELRRLMDKGTESAVLDVRTPVGCARDPRRPGARRRQPRRSAQRAAARSGNHPLLYMT
jgi:uncharacterized protein YjeT (DUF2065 family)